MSKLEWWVRVHVTSPPVRPHVLLAICTNKTATLSVKHTPHLAARHWGPVGRVLNHRWRAQLALGFMLKGGAKEGEKIKLILIVLC